MRIDTNPNALKKLIAAGESEVVEFKTICPPDHVVAQVLSAFANSDGGILLIGVDDNGKIDGLNDQHYDDAEDILKRVSSSLFPWPIEIDGTTIDNRSIVYALVDKAPQHYYPIMTSRGEIYERRADKIVRFSEAAISKTVAQVASASKRSAKSQAQVIVFVAMSFREEEEPSLVDYFRAMERAVFSTQLPLTLRRMDLVDGDFEISQKIMDEIDAAQVVIADFTLNSRNVYFEAGYARAKRRRVIQSARKGTVLEFDIKTWKTLFYRNATELEQGLVRELVAAYSEVTKKPS